MAKYSGRPNRSTTAAVFLAGEGSTIFLRLMLEDREDLAAQLVLRERNEYVGFTNIPLLPRAAIVPHLGLLA